MGVVSWIVGYGLIGVLASVTLLWLALKKLTKNRFVRSCAVTLASMVLISATVVTGYGVWVASGSKAERKIDLGEGVDYEKFRLPGGGVAHLATIDLAAACLTPVTNEYKGSRDTIAATTRVWAEQNDLLLAMNASFFFPFVEYPFWKAYPDNGDPVTVLGESINDGQRQGRRKDWEGHVVYMDGQRKPEIAAEYPEDATWGVSGRTQILTDGKITAETDNAYPRTVIAVDDTTQRMWWLVVDGKQPGYSDGSELIDVANYLKSLGAVDALELDGGGSSTMAATVDGNVEQLNRPAHTRIPGRSRTVANHIGIASSC